MTIDMNIYKKIITSFPAVPPEWGCILGSYNNCICTFQLDSGCAQLDMAVYTPNVEFLNLVISKWAAAGIKLCGLAHSHPLGQQLLSCVDIAYIRRIMQALPMSIEKLYFPLVFPGEKIVSFAAIRHTKQIDILPDNIIIK